MWAMLKQYFPDYEFRRQHPMSNYVADFYCHKLMLVIEVDGPIHRRRGKQKLDEVRQTALENLRIKVFRCTNEQVRNDVESGLKNIDQFIKSKTS